MTTPDDTSRILAVIEDQMRRMVAGEEGAYTAGWNIWGAAMSGVARSPDILHPLWLIWGGLTDWVENCPGEKDKAELEMMRASREWLSIKPSDCEGRTAYLQRWVYDEIGYVRKKNP